MNLLNTSFVVENCRYNKEKKEKHNQRKMRPLFVPSLHHHVKRISRTNQVPANPTMVIMIKEQGSQRLSQWIVDFIGFGIADGDTRS